MRFVLYFIIFLTSIQIGFSQNKEFDSIKKLVELHKERDIKRVNLLNKLTKYYTTIDISKNESILNEAIAISEEINYLQGITDSYTNLTSLFIQSGNYDKALNLALKTKELQEKAKDFSGEIYTNSNIARIYNHLEKPNKAIEIQLENLRLLKKSPNDNLKAQIHFYLATAYSEKKDFNKAAFHYTSTKRLAKKLGFKTGIAIANSSLGVLENKRGNYKTAIKYLSESLVFFTANNQIANIAHTDLELAVAYANSGEIDKAILANKKAIKIYKEQKNLKNLRRAYLELSNYYKLNKDYLNSSKNLKNHYLIKDSIFAKEKVSVIEEMQTKYETEKALIAKEKALQETELVKLENKTQRNIFIGSVLIATLLFLVLLFYFRQLKTKKKSELIAIELKETQKRLAIEKQYKDSELKALKAQMNPHFIFNALNSIQDYIVLNQKNLASDYLGKFADLIRNYLHFSDTGFISVPDEIHNLDLYLELEKLRFEDKLLYSFYVDENVNSEMIKIPTMLIQPYVENALKHGLLHKKNDRKLSISIAKVSDKIIECTIKDNGIGREKSKEINSKRKLNHKSFALKATTERLELLNFGKEKKIGVEIIDLIDKNKVRGTKVILKIPILKR